MNNTQNPHLNIITVFGGTGFLGRHIINALARTGATIRVATRIPQRAYFLRPAGRVGQIVPVFCDIHDDASVNAVLQGASHAVNLLGVLFEKGRKGSFEKIHIEAAERIARACRAQGLQLLAHVSALGASAQGPSRYARTKALGEDKVIHAFPKTVVLRPSVVFGPDDNFFNLFARMARVTGTVPLIAGGRTKFQPVYVGDIAQAIENIFSTPDDGKFFGQIYEIGGPYVYTLRELMDMMLKYSRQDAKLVSVPSEFAKIIGLFAGLAPRPLLTIDQVDSLKKDNVLPLNTSGLRLLGVNPTDLEAILPQYMQQYWPGGRFAQRR